MGEHDSLHLSLQTLDTNADADDLLNKIKCTSLMPVMGKTKKIPTKGAIIKNG